MSYLEQFRDLFAGAVHRGPDDVGGGLSGKLDDVFGQVGLDPLDPGIGQGMGQADFFAQHGFRSRHQLGLCIQADAGDDRPRLGIVGCPVDLRARCSGVALELFKIMVQIGDHVILDRAPAGAGVLEFGKRRHRHRALGLGRAGGAVDGDLQRPVRQCRLGSVLERNLH